DLKYDITRSLKVDFHADNNSRIMEPYGAINTQEKKDSIKQSLFRGGDNTMYTQRTKVDYAIPINKFPMLDWISSNASYATDYKWTRAPYSADSLGNFIQNGNQKTLNMQGNLTTLYNKVPFLKKVNQGIKKKKDEKKEGIKQPSKTPKDSTKKKEKEPVLFPQYFARTLMMLKNVSLNITDNEGSSLAGYGYNTRFFGMNDKNKWSPGPAFVFGKQDNFGKDSLHFTDYAAQKGWIVKNKLLNVPFTKNKTTNITARANLELLPGFKIELTANKNQSINNSEFFRWAYDSTLGAETYMHQSPIESGNFSMSFITWHTAFEKIHADYFSAAFQNMLNYRETISNKLAEKYDHSKGLPGNFAPGYGNTSQNVLLYSFLSAYSGKDPNNYSLDLSPTTPLPNWRITYDGLGKIKQLKKIFKTITLSHAYRSSYSFSYTNNLNSNLKQAGKPINQDINDNYIFYEQLNSVTIAEQLSPLIKVDVSLQNSVQINAEIKKERNLSLSFANNQLTEVRSNELVIGSGYKWKDVPLKNPFSKSKKTSKKTIKSDINIRADFSVRQNLTLIRKVVEQVTQPTAGQIVYALKTSADYQISQRITARLFYDWNFNNPRISTSFKSKNTNAGVSIRFSLI
ncbi:MAG TPA: cell surface protein SprA, partial [Bacteroidia bacterium]|nr:cell surface protein SprA [Bacteroidia bacterium]